jgi:ATP-dependent DNA ligase
VLAMEARSVDSLPRGIEWQYEPKWDGFRCLLIRTGDRLRMQSKSGRDLVRYFPEVASAAMSLADTQFTLDGELVIPAGNQFSFDDLLQRIHPAPSRIKRLAEETPAVFLAFDLLRCGTADVAKLPLVKRRPALERFAKRSFKPSRIFRLSPASRIYADAKRWLASAGSGSDGVIAKRVDLPYQGGNREGMQKIKRKRSADCVIGGFRYGENRVAGRKVVGSLLLGLYDEKGLLNHVGFTSGLKSGQKAALTDELEAMISDRSFTGNAPGGLSRWSTKRSAEWQPVKPSLVIEVSYDHFTGGRFRHGTTILRWRPDKKPQQCTMEQLQQKAVLPSTVLQKSASRSSGKKVKSKKQAIAIGLSAARKKGAKVPKKKRSKKS